MVFTVTTLDDVDDGTCDNNCSLREAIYAANDNPGADTINFNLSGTIQLDKTLPYILDTAGLTIDGTGQTVAIQWNRPEQVFYIAAGVPFTLQGMKVSGGTIYNVGTLILKDSTYENASSATDTLTNTASPFVDSNIANFEARTFKYYPSNGCPIYSEGSLTITGSYLTDCYIHTVGDLTITGNTFTNGRPYSLSTMTITNSTFTGSYTDVRSEGALTRAIFLVLAKTR
jgi:CSLREA domain-containing protein